MKKYYAVLVQVLHPSWESSGKPNPYYYITIKNNNWNWWHKSKINFGESLMIAKVDHKMKENPYMRSLRFDTAEQAEKWVIDNISTQDRYIKFRDAQKAKLKQAQDKYFYSKTIITT